MTEKTPVQVALEYRHAAKALRDKCSGEVAKISADRIEFVAAAIEKSEKLPDTMELFRTAVRKFPS